MNSDKESEAPLKPTVFDFSEVLRRLAFLGLVMVLSLGAGLQNAAAQTELQELYDFLRHNMHFSKGEFTKMKGGEIVTKLLDSKLRREVFVFGVMRVNVPRPFFVENYRDNDIFIEIVDALESGQFSHPPELQDIQNLMLDPSDVQAIKECKVGHCDIKMSARSMEQFRREIDWIAPDYPQQVQDLFHKKMVQYVTSYLAGGNAALAEFDDQKYPLRLADEFHDLLRESRYLYVYAPEFHKYLEGYPHVALSNVENFVYWSKEDIGTKRRVISITHMTLYEPQDSTIFDVLVASKKIYASHYFEAGFGLTALADDPEDGTAGFYLLFLNRWRIDALRHPHFGGILRKKVRGGLRKLYEKKMILVKTRVEEIYRNKK